MFTRSRASFLSTIVVALAFALGAIATTGQRRQAAGTTPATNPNDSLKVLQWRQIGPFRGGRSTAVAGVATQPMVFDFGGVGGGVWKTSDGGINWEPITDGSVFGTASVGAIGLSDSDPNTIYVGMGESPIRGNVSHGDGVYKSTDGGKTWKHVGLEDTRQISRIRVHPKNPDIVYVAAQGHVWASNADRGVFRSKDGGKTWQKVLFRSDQAGACDLIIDPTNPNVLYAGFWEVYRKPWTLESGGAGSGIFKSTDGGDTWTEITRNQGLPRGPIGIVGITVSPANPDRLWAIVEAEDGGVFRSDNGGRTWTKTNEERNLRQRAWYYSRIYADPKNADTVYVLNTGFYRSNDGGRTFTGIGVPHGDNHDLWIAPEDPNRMIESNDGGANVSFNGGRSWSEEDQATAQFYRVTLDNDFPYHVYGAQQDNSTVRIASRTTDNGITANDWFDVGGGESGWIAPSPKDSLVIFAGSYDGLITRYDHHTGQLRDVNPYPNNPMGWGAGDIKYRFQWNFPIVFSPHDQNTLYAGANVLFKSTNEGQSWEVISPDLTRNDKSKQGPSGGPITKDNTSIEYYNTIFTVAPSPKDSSVIWVGTDDGLVQVTRDGGKSWQNVTPKDVPEWALVSTVEASPHDAATAYVAATRYKLDDFRPYVYKTSDYGRSWKKIVTGFPETHFVRVVREDPARRGLLFAGTEFGMYVSFDDGASWQTLQLNLPVAPIHDLTLKDHDLAAATHGRAFWVLDDITPLEQLSDEIAHADRHLFTPRDAVRFRGPSFVPARSLTGLGTNPPNGATVYFYVKQKPEEDATLDFLDARDSLVRRFSSRPKEPADSLKAEAGLNRFVWDLRYADAHRFKGLVFWAGNTRGPLAMPGSYKGRRTVGGWSGARGFNVMKDPRGKATQDDLQKQA